MKVNIFKVNLIGYSYFLSHSHRNNKRLLITFQGKQVVIKQSKT